MTREEIEEKTSLCFLLNPKYSEEEKNCVIEKVMATKATIVSKVALCNIITYIQKQNAKLKAQIEKMKCCENCKHHYWLYEELACRIHKIDVDTCNSWEMVNGR